MRMRRGATLVEVALAGAIAVLLTLAFMEGIAVAARISHENSQLLAAEAYAWDTAWKWLNKPYDELNNTATAVFYPSAAGETVSSNACPVLCRALNGGADAKVFVRVTFLTGASALRRHEADAEAKLIEVDVEWGPASDRRCLNGLASGARSYSVPVSVYKGPLERGT
ncbi:MAG: hypothetical protein II391_03315 [Kiritimatiellae bacterium]|nr:hypothetical protein [Kiritimatiellia bacterium]